MTSRKKPVNRGERIVWRLKNMIRFSKQLKIHWSDEQAMAAQDKYIRVCGESIRLVSLADDSALCRFKDLGPRKSVDALARRARGDLSIEGMNKALAKSKQERRLQAYLIKSALLESRELLGTLSCLSGKLKSLLFAYDKISFGDKSFGKGNSVRLDILAVGTNHSDESFPVIIELKSKRSYADLKWLGIQLRNAERELTGMNSPAADVIACFLTAATGIKPTLPDQVMKVLVWPAGGDSQQIKSTLEKYKDQITFIEYTAGSTFPTSTSFQQR